MIRIVDTWQELPSYPFKTCCRNPRIDNRTSQLMLAGGVLKDYVSRFRGQVWVSVVHGIGWVEG